MAIESLTSQLRFTKRPAVRIGRARQGGFSNCESSSATDWYHSPLRLWSWPATPPTICYAGLQVVGPKLSTEYKVPRSLASVQAGLDFRVHPSSIRKAKSFPITPHTRQTSELPHLSLLFLPVFTFATMAPADPALPPARLSLSRVLAGHDLVKEGRHLGRLADVSLKDDALGPELGQIRDHLLGALALLP